MLTCEHPQSGFYFLLKRSFGKVGQLCRAVHLPEAPIHSERAVSLCSPALLTSSLPTECAQRTGASLIPLIWGVPWDLTKHSSDKDMRSQRCRGIPTVGGRQTDWVRLWDGETEKCFLQTMRTLTWHRPLGDFFLPLLPSLYHLPPPRPPPSAPICRLWTPVSESTLQMQTRPVTILSHLGPSAATVPGAAFEALLLTVHHCTSRGNGKLYSIYARKKGGILLGT